MMLTSRWNNTSTTRLPLILPNIGDTSQRQQQVFQGTPRRSISNDSIQSIDNAYSLEHLFTALRRRIRRIIQTYNVTSFYHALKICARVFQSYASYNLNTIDEFARLLTKGARDNKNVLTFIDQYRLHLSELRHCHSTFEAELLVTTLAIDFHEDDSEQQASLPVSTGKFSPRSRLSKFRLQHIRQAMELKSQLKQTNEHLQILLYDEFSANVSNLWDESEKFISASIPFHDHHMTYILRLIPDIALKFEYALQICVKLFDLETTMIENYPQTNRTNKNFSETTPVMTQTLTPRSDYNPQQPPPPPPPTEIPQQHNRQRMRLNKKSQKPSAFFSADVTSASSVSSVTKLTNTIASPIPLLRREEPLDIIDQPDEHLIIPFPEKTIDDKNDQTKLRLLIEQLEKRLIDEESSRKRLLDCIQQTTKKSEELNRFPKNNMLALVMTDEPAIAEYQKALCSSDYQIYKSVADELNIAIRETQHRIDWIHMVRARALQCLDQ